MKKGLLLVGAFVAVTFASCKKDFVCKCSSGGFEYEYTMKESKKAAAYAVCEGKGIGSVEVDGQTVEDEGGCSIQ